MRKPKKELALARPPHCDRDQIRVPQVPPSGHGKIVGHGQLLNPIEFLPSALVPGLKYKRGLNEWHLATKDCSQFFSRYSEVPESLQSTMRPYMFPPTEEEAARFNLDRCMRVLPHLQVT